MSHSAIGRKDIQENGEKRVELLSLLEQMEDAENRGSF